MTTYGKLLVGGAALLILIVAAYVFTTGKATAPTNEETPAAQTSEPVITWRIVDTETNAAGTPHQEISITVDGTTYVAGTFPGTCSEVKTGGGVDGTGLLAGELAAMQCWWAGSGDEIGIFAHEDGGYQILVGELGEPTAEEAGFRGNFKIKVDIPG